ncbi:hypothetical protein WOLCODRAFT_155991 [Wolfiporia cocos MD-104 SS10]|uniref:Uncharacterized protein n=1 Tax=Wolfiporia cocos (strain MD-104) TaxID=742152 RepID=A0A2H3IZB9_WOLCO|nr:hypothetical protein WOLCODRAFT_155991 [Wolfiporia cocos MD-104 SS10]
MACRRGGAQRGLTAAVRRSVANGTGHETGIGVSGLWTHHDRAEPLDADASRDVEMSARCVLSGFLARWRLMDEDGDGELCIMCTKDAVRASTFGQLLYSNLERAFLRKHLVGSSVDVYDVLTCNLINLTCWVRRFSPVFSISTDLNFVYNLQGLDTVIEVLQLEVRRRRDGDWRRAWRSERAS